MDRRFSCVFLYMGKGSGLLGIGFFCPADQHRAGRLRIEQLFVPCRRFFDLQAPFENEMKVK